MDPGLSVARRLEVSESPEGVGRAAADLFCQIATHSIQDRDEFRVALSGGSTPKILYRVLAGDAYLQKVDWSRTHVFFSDERFVPPESLESNYRSALDGLLSKVRIPPGNVHPVPTVNIDPDAAAQQYSKLIESDVPGDPWPRFDLIFLGMGADGHTASLFPGSDALRIDDRLVAPNFVEKLKSWRITFTFPLLNAGRTVLFLVTGEDKAARVEEIAAGADYPAARVKPDQGELVWLLDSAAASRLPAR
jgi:6-phosphogluconolactonase